MSECVCHVVHANDDDDDDDALLITLATVQSATLPGTVLIYDLYWSCCVTILV